MDRLDQSKARNSNLENDNLTWTYRTADARGPMVERMLKSRASWPIFPLLTSLDNPHKHLDSPSSPPRPICPQPLWENRDVVEWHARTQVICHDTTVGGQRSHQKPKSHHHVVPRPRGLQLLLFQHGAQHLRVTLAGGRSKGSPLFLPLPPMYPITPPRGSRSCEQFQQMIWFAMVSCQSPTVPVEAQMVEPLDAFYSYHTSFDSSKTGFPSGSCSIKMHRPLLSPAIANEPPYPTLFVL